MVCEKFVIADEAGLHMRPASDFCTKALEYSCKIHIYKGNCCYNAKSLLSMLSACIKCGDELVLECDGAGEEQALKALAAVLQGQ